MESKHFETKDLICKQLSVGEGLAHKTSSEDMECDENVTEIILLGGE